MRCLILGATGLIGSHLAAATADRRYAHLGTGYRRPEPEHAPLDLRDAEAVEDLIADYLPDVTFLAAGVSCGARAEENPEECRELTVQGTAQVAAAVARHGGSLVYFSTDAVFSNCRHAKREDDHVTPRGVLAEAKVRAEALVRAELPDRHLILRTSWVFGPGEGNRGHAEKFLRPMAEGDTVRVANDRYGQPTYAPDLADVALDLAARGHIGTVHAVGPDRHTEFTFARLAAHIFGHDTDQVDPVPASTLGDGDPRPNKVWLDRFQLRSLLGPRAIRPVADGLRTIRDGLPATLPLLRAA